MEHASYPAALIRMVKGTPLPKSRALGKEMEVELARPVETSRALIMTLHNGQVLGFGHRLFLVALGLSPGAMDLPGWPAWRRRLRARQQACLSSAAATASRTDAG